MSTRLDMRKKGYMGVILDGKKLTEICRQIYALQYVNPTAKMSVDDLLLIELAEKDVFGDHKIAVVNTEGVGYMQDTYRTIEVPTNVGEHGFWNGRVHISADVIKLCVTEQMADIAEYVRVFGDRLDHNVEIWQDLMPKP